MFDIEDTFKSKQFTDKLDINKVRNIRCVSYETVEELRREIDNEKNVPFDIIIDMSSLYNYKIDNCKIIPEKIDINFKEMFPNSYVIKIDDYGSKKKIEILEILKEQLLKYNEAYGYINPAKHYFGVIDDEDDFYKVNGDSVGTTDVNDIYKTVRRVLVRK